MTPHQPERPERGWWNRNVLGLLTILPLLAALIASRGPSIYQAVWTSQPRIDITVAQEQWAETPNVKTRLAEFGVAENLVTTSGRAVQLPDGVKAWRAVIEFDTPNAPEISSCKLSLEDTGGRLYSTAPDELPSIRGAAYMFAPCSAPNEQKSGEYSVTALFVTPADAKPATLQIHWTSMYPRYVRLAIAG